jgi:hypothetical protein
MPEESVTSAVTNTPTRGGAVANPHPSEGGSIAARGLEIEAARMNTLYEAMVKKRKQQTTERPKGFQAGLQNAMLEGFLGSMPTAMGAKDEGIVGEEDEMMAQGTHMAREAARSERLATMTQMARTKADQMPDGKEGQEARSKIQKEVRKAANVAIRRGVEYLIQSVAGILDLGTWVTFIADLFIHAFVLLDLNIQMIYGYYIAKDKSLLFPALKWAPLRLPLPDIFLHAGVVLLDLIVLLFIMVIGLAVFIIVFSPFIIASAGIGSVFHFFGAI